MFKNSFLVVQKLFQEFTNFKASKLNKGFPILWGLFLKEISSVIRLPFVSYQFCNVRNVDTAKLSSVCFPNISCTLIWKCLQLTDATFRSLVILALCAAYRVDLCPSVPTEISLDTHLQWGPLLAPRHCKPLFFGYHYHPICKALPSPLKSISSLHPIRAKLSPVHFFHFKGPTLHTTQDSERY